MSCLYCKFSAIVVKCIPENYYSQTVSSTIILVFNQSIWHNKHSSIYLNSSMTLGGTREIRLVTNIWVVRCKACKNVGNIIEKKNSTVLKGLKMIITINKTWAGKVFQWCIEMWKNNNNINTILRTNVQTLLLWLFLWNGYKHNYIKIRSLIAVPFWDTDLFGHTRLRRFWRHYAKTNINNSQKPWFFYKQLG